MNPRAVAGIFVAGVLAAGAAVAQSASTRVAAQSDWSIFVEQKPKQCWVVSAPKKTVNTKDGREVAVNRGEIFMFVSFWPDNKQLGEVSFMGGYPFADEVATFIAAHEQVFVVEQNRDAQMRTLLVNELGVDPARLVPVLHYDGTPITARFIAGEIGSRADGGNVTPIDRRARVA